MSRALVMGAMLSMVGCGKEAPKVRCGAGTVLRDNQCVAVIEVAPARASDAAPSQDAVTVDASSLATWQYKTAHDRMRDEDTRIAQIESVDTSMVLGEPSHLLMALRQGPKDKVADVMFVAEHGHFRCERLMCIHSRFDKGTVKAWPGSEADPGTPQALFMGGTDKAKRDWIQLLKSSSELTLEVDLLGSGQQQFTFQVTGLVWEEADKR